MKHVILLLGLMLAACQQASPRAENTRTDAANEASKAPPRANAAAPRPAAIPDKFRGVWADGRAACAQLSHPSRMIISEKVIRYPSFVLISERVDIPTDSSVAVKGRNQRTGAPAEAHYSIDATGNVLTDEAGGGAVRARCG